MGGGRYDGLVEEMGGPPTPSVGWAGGVERLSLLVEQAGNLPPVARPIHVIPVGEAEEALALTTLQALREAGLVAETAYRGNLKRRLERANKGHARAALIIGESEAARGVAQLRMLDAGTQEEVALDALPGRLAP
jgi:histidyl-tRNA synthetase